MRNTIDFLGVRRICIGASLLAIFAGIVSLFFKSGPNLGIDFRGGVHVVAEFAEEVSVSDATSALTQAGISSPKVVVAPDNTLLIDALADEAGTGQKIVQALKGKFSLADSTITEVGANVGKDLRKTGIITIILSFGLLLIYISFRFQWHYAVGAVLALVHDVLITLGMFSFLNLEINLPTLAAFLTVVGYSVNDTIIIFDRVRENQRLLRGMRLTELINISITQTLTRTLITSLLTLMVVVVIFLESGPGELRNFSLALIFGIIVGTYSSIYIASPIVVWLHPKAIGVEA